MFRYFLEALFPLNTIITIINHIQSSFPSGEERGADMEIHTHILFLFSHLPAPGSVFLQYCRRHSFTQLTVCVVPPGVVHQAVLKRGNHKPSVAAHSGYLGFFRREAFLLNMSSRHNFFKCQGYVQSVPKNQNDNEPNCLLLRLVPCWIRFQLDLRESPAPFFWMVSP